MADILLLLIVTLSSGALFCLADLQNIRAGYLPIGTVFFAVYTLTYSIGLLLWRIDPDSLFGYSTDSTLSGLSTMIRAFSLGIASLAASYLVCRSTFRRLTPAIAHPYTILDRHSKALVPFIFFIFLLVFLLFPWLIANGMFAREITNGSAIMTQPIIVTLSKSANLLSRIFPVALLLTPGLYARFSKTQKIFSLLLLSSAVIFSLYTSSRTIIFTVPVYLLVGFLFWHRPTFKWIVPSLALVLALSIPIAENVRVIREGDASQSELTRKYQTFQIGKQLIGTSHDFYVYINPASCKNDLSALLSKDETTRLIQVQGGVKSFPPDSYQRWHVSGLLSACGSRDLGYRLFEGLNRFPLGLLPRTLGFSAPSLFDGQALSAEISNSLGLRPGEISNSTLSLFADSWWRARWVGIFMVFTLFGIFLSLVQYLIDYQASKSALVALLAQMLMLTLLGSWINNTVLTTLWLTFWELPKALFLCYISVVFVKSLRSFHGRLKV